MLTAETIAFLRSPAGVELLAEAAAMPPDPLTRLTRLRRKCPPELAAAAVVLLSLRKRGTAKFNRAENMFFTPAGLEQSSGEIIARWRAGRFPEGATVLDLCSGIGGDAVALGSRGPVLSVDLDPAAVACVLANAGVYGVVGTVHAACADVTKLRLHGDTAFFDPSRRRGERRVRSGEEYSPPLEFVHDIRRAVPNLCIKVSPALEDAILDSLGGRIGFVSDRGECKEAVLWFGDLGPRSRRSATILPAGASLDEDLHAPKPAVTRPRSWLYEPDAAIVRAHLIPEIAERLQTSQIDPQIAYLTSDTLVETLFATAYPVLEWMPFNLKKVQARLKTLGRTVTAIKRRGVPLDPMVLGKQLTGGGDEPCVVVLTRMEGAPAAIVCGPAVQMTQDGASPFYNNPSTLT